MFKIILARNNLQCKTRKIPKVSPERRQLNLQEGQCHMNVYAERCTIVKIILLIALHIECQLSLKNTNNSFLCAYPYSKLKDLQTNEVNSIIGNLHLLYHMIVYCPSPQMRYIFLYYRNLELHVVSFSVGHWHRLWVTLMSDCCGIACCKNSAHDLIAR